MVNSRAVLAIDPGPTKSAWVLWDGAVILDKGLCANASFPWHSVLQYCDRVVIEMVASYGMPVGKDVFETCVWIGQCLAYTCLMAPERIYRKDIKMHLCHSMRANDASIRQALIDRFGPPGTKKVPGILYGVKRDMWAAMAVAVTWWDRND